MGSVPDYYALLGVSPDAGTDEVRRAYRKAVLRSHPDRNGNSAAAGEMMRAVNEAWAVLRDAERRAEYDRRYREAYGCGDRLAGQVGNGVARVWVSRTVFTSASCGR